MNWNAIYEERKTTAENAIELIHSGDRVALGNVMGAPFAIMEVLAENKEEYENVELVQMLSLGNARFAQADMAGHFRLNSLFIGGLTKKALIDGNMDYTPCDFHRIPELFDEILPLDVAIIQVSSPDAHGYVSCGVCIDYTLSAARKAKKVIAQVNRHMPRTHGDTTLHVSEIDAFVEADCRLLELPPQEIGEEERLVGENCAKLVRDGDTLQLGIGGIPAAVLEFLKDRKDLGIHSEMISDGIVDLIRGGVITNKKKTLHPEKCVITFVMGSQKLYDFLDDNPIVAMYPASYVNDPYIIGQNDNLVSINSCIQVDLQGQIAAESIGLTQISGIGGQADFVRGARRSKGGRSIIAITSTVNNGKISKIVPFLNEGAAVTTPRTDVDYVVTEFGIAHLRGKTLRDRARALIEIAHPDFRPELIKEFEKRFQCKFA